MEGVSRTFSLEDDPVLIPGSKERKEALDDLFGCMTKEEGEELLRIIEEGCGRIDPEDWGPGSIFDELDESE